MNPCRYGRQRSLGRENPGSRQIFPDRQEIRHVQKLRLNFRWWKNCQERRNYGCRQIFPDRLKPRQLRTFWLWQNSRAWKNHQDRQNLQDGHAFMVQPPSRNEISRRYREAKVGAGDPGKSGPVLGSDYPS